MLSKTDSELREYINNKSQFQDNAVFAAIWELEKRENLHDSDKELINQFEQEVNLRREKIEKVKRDSNVTDDPSAPLLYHPKYILVFGVLFSVFAAGILMAMNLSRLNKGKSSLLTLFTGLAFTAVQIVVLGLIEFNTTALTFPINYLGINLLESLFWKKNVSRDLKFRKRSIWPPLFIGILITIVYIYLLILTAGF